MGGAFTARVLSILIAAVLWKLHHKNIDTCTGVIRGVGSLPVCSLSWSCICLQVFILNNPEECNRVLKTILEQRRLCPLISPFFTPNAAPGELVSLYQDVVTSLHLDSADVVFMLLTKVCPDALKKYITQWIHHSALTALHLLHAVWLVPVAEWNSSCVFGANTFAGVGPWSSVCLWPRPGAWTSHTFSPVHQTLDVDFTAPFPWPLQWLPASAYDQ